MAYCTSSAIGNYLTEPFVFTQPGVQTREIAPWTEDTQIRQRVAVTFPKIIAITTPIRFSTSATHSCSGAWTIHLTLQVSRRSHTTYTITTYSMDSCSDATARVPSRRKRLRNQRFAPITIDVIGVRWGNRVDVLFIARRNRMCGTEAVQEGT